MPSLDVEQLINPDKLACAIGDKWTAWHNSTKEKQWQELRNYVFATDTTTTTNAKLPWKNKTTRPKLCQIRDNLHANYMSALFPNDRWFKWEAKTLEDADVAKAKSVRAYLSSKMRDHKFKEIVSRLVYDYIDYGNCFVEAEYVAEADNNYTGPRPVRVSPLDIRFDLSAKSFEATPKIIRTLVSLADLQSKIQTDPVFAGFDKTVLDRIVANRQHVAGSNFNTSDLSKSAAFVADGFKSLTDYYGSGLVEILEFEGDIFDVQSGAIHKAHVVHVVDRAYIASKQPISSISGRSAKFHCGWRLRPDNLMAMGPLDNLVGMQYRIDHLENLRADTFDLIANPPLKVKGYVEPFTWGPGEHIFLEQDADVTSLVPDTTVLNADTQIRDLEFQMEEMAGAPREAAGFRTPGEKTAFEVQALQSAANRIFLHKIGYFEEHFLEPLLNAMLELARENMDAAESVAILDPDYNAQSFQIVSVEDLKARGKLVPMGARQFASQAQLIQNLSGLAGTGLYQDPAINVHFSGYKLAKLIEENIGLSEYGVVSPNARLLEQTETQKLAQTAQESTVEHGLIDPAPAEEFEDDAGPETVDPGA